MMNPPPEQAPLASPPSAALRAHLRRQTGAGGVLNYRDFTAAALYAPGLGYYARPEARRVGRRAGSDFYTASSLSGGILGKLLRAAATILLAPDAPGAYTLVELGAEPGESIFGNEAGAFVRIETRRLGDDLTPPPMAVIFANELLDAQPFHRLVFRRGTWRELGVRVDGDELVEVEMPEVSAAAQSLRPDLPDEADEDYHLDYSLDAEKLLRELIAAPWNGLLLLADYGYDWVALTGERASGTARAYYRHAVSGDLLARPGEQDLTCQVCWDRLEKILREGGFESVRVERQEAFLLGHASAAIEALLAESAAVTTGKIGTLSTVRQTMMELLHPAHLGHKFQVLSARRTGSDPPRHQPEAGWNEIVSI